MEIPISRQHSVPLLNPLTANLHVNPLGFSQNLYVTDSAQTVGIGNAFTQTHKGKHHSWDSIAQKFTWNFLEYTLPMEQNGNVASQSNAHNINLTKHQTTPNDMSAKSQFFTPILDLKVSSCNFGHNPAVVIEQVKFDDNIPTSQVQNGSHLQKNKQQFQW